MNLYDKLKNNNDIPKLKTQFLSKDRAEYQMGLCEGRVQMHQEFMIFLKSVNISQTKIADAIRKLRNNPMIHDTNINIANKICSTDILE